MEMLEKLPAQEIKLIQVVVQTYANHNEQLLAKKQLLKGCLSDLNKNPRQKTTKSDNQDFNATCQLINKLIKESRHLQQMLKNLEMVLTEYIPANEAVMIIQAGPGSFCVGKQIIDSTNIPQVFIKAA